MLESFEAEGQRADTGGGALEFHVPSNGLYLTRAFSHVMENKQFVAELTRLMEASKVWKTERIDPIASRAFGSSLGDYP